MKIPTQLRHRLGGLTGPNQISSMRVTSIFALISFPLQTNALYAIIFNTCITFTDPRTVYFHLAPTYEERISLFSYGPNYEERISHQEDQWLYVTLRHFRRFCCLYCFASVHVYSENSGLQSSIIFALQSLIPTEKWHLHVDDFSNCLRFIIHHLRSSRQTVLFE